MADEASDLLMYGVAAARANSRDEARNYLEWVLRTDADPDQQAEAWYWLSTITDDHVEKRSYLESALAAAPNYPEARRDLAILDGRLEAAQLLEPLSEVRPVHPHVDLQANEIVQYKCPRCGARLTADRVSGNLLCTFCGYRPAHMSQTPGASEVPSAQIREQDWDAAIFSVKGHRWDVPTARTFKCQNCGASVLVPQAQMSTTCPFCATPHVVAASEERELIEPTALLPFILSANDATAAILRWLSGERFAPEDLSRRSTQAVAHPVYLPAWTFDVSGEVRWSGYEVRIEFKHAKMVPTGGSVPLLFEDVLSSATNSLSSDLLSQLQFDTHSLVPYARDLLANWPAEIYSIPPAEASLTRATGRCTARRHRTWSAPALASAEQWRMSALTAPHCPLSLTSWCSCPSGLPHIHTTA